MLGNPEKKEIIILIKQIRCQLALGAYIPIWTTCLAKEINNYLYE